MPPAQITLVRHGESQHNIFKEHDRYPDALLTPVGESQAVQISTFFPVTPLIDLIVTSPLRRALHTTRLAFSRQINQQGLVPVALPELQESNSKPCNIGSSVMILEQQWPGVDFTLVRAVETGKDEEGDWRSKLGKWSQEGDALKDRARWVRKWLYQRKEAHVVCILHANVS